MRKWVMALAILALAGCQAPSAVRTASSAAHAAADKFAALAAKTPDAPPRAADPAAGPLLDTVFNTAAVQGQPPAWDDIDAVDDWLLSALKVGQAYMLAGTGVTDASAIAPGSPAEAKAEQNTATYAPEMGRFFDAELAIGGAASAMTAQYLAANPDAAKQTSTAQGLDKARAGFTETVVGVMQEMLNPGLANDWREARARSLVAFAQRAAPFFTDAQKQEMAQAANQAAAQLNDPQLTQLLGQFATTITGKGG